MAKKKCEHEGFEWLILTWVFLFITCCGLGTYISHLKIELNQEHEKAVYWRLDDEKLSAAFAGSEKDFVEMQDYAWKLERRLKKCEQR